MSSQLQLNDLASRLNNFPHDRYLYIGGFMRSVAWAAGTIVFLHILRNFPKYFPRLLPWALSFVATMLTLTTWGRGILLTNSRANKWDSFFPMFMGIMEFLMFAILAPPEIFGGESNPRERNSTKARQREIQTEALKDERKCFLNPHAWYFWFFLFAIHAGLAVLLVNNRIINTSPETDYVSELHPLACQYMEWMYSDRGGALTGAIISSVFGVIVLTGTLTFNWAKPRKPLNKCLVVLRYLFLGLFPIVYVALFAIIISIYWGVINQAEGQRQIADNEVSRIQQAARDDVKNKDKKITQPKKPGDSTPCPSPPASIFGR